MTNETVQVRQSDRAQFQAAMVDAARARGGAGAHFIAAGETNLWLDIAYDAFARHAEQARSEEGEHRGHRFGSPPEPVVNPSEDWCDQYADWYYQGRG